MDKYAPSKELREEIIVKEGIPFIIVPLLLSILFLLIGISFLGIPFLALSVFTVYFFRNPSRRAPAIESATVSPADGKVIEVLELSDAPYLHGRGTKVSIFMSPFNVHVNRMPLSGRVVDILYKKGRFRPAFEDKTSRENEQNVLLVELSEGQQMALVQVAGVLARRISCWVKKGEYLQRGQRFGLIRFGSRIDCYFPPEFEVDARTGQRVWGGETILGYMK